MEINNMQSASKAIAEFRPTELGLRGGLTVTVDEMAWPMWRKCWSEIRELINVGYGVWRADREEKDAGAFYNQTTKPGVTRTKSSTQQGEFEDEFQVLDAEAFKVITTQAGELYNNAASRMQQSVESAINKIEVIPDLMERIICGSVKVEGALVGSEFLEARSHTEVMAMLRESLRLNFFENQEVLDFFAEGAVWLTLVRGPQPSAGSELGPNEA